MSTYSPPQLVLVTSLVMVAFALNSILCRLALATGAIGWADFTTVRLISGAAVLWLLVVARSRKARIGGDWSSAALLFGYAACFSFAYVSLSTGTGALLLFGAVQITMISWGLLKGERLSPGKWAGVVSAFLGLAWFMSPGVEAPPLLGSLLMIASGICWGAYSLRGRGAMNASADTAGNFVRAAPLAVTLYLLGLGEPEAASGTGWLLAILSGALASGLGYALWYAVLPQLSSATSATVQLSVPIIAAVAGVLLLDEAMSLRLVLASAVVLGGIWVFIRSGQQNQGRS